MTFEEYMSDHFGCDDPSYAAATYSKVWNAAQQAEREKRKPLSDEEIESMADDCAEGGDDESFVFLYRDFARAIEKAHGIGGAE